MSRVGKSLSFCVQLLDTSREISGTPNNGTPENGKRDPYHSHIFRDSNMGVGLGSHSMGPA